MEKRAVIYTKDGIKDLIRKDLENKGFEVVGDIILRTDYHTG